MGSMTADNKYDHLILSLSRLGFSKQSGLLGSCKVSYGCQAHLLSIMKVVCISEMIKVTKMMMSPEAHLAGSLRLLSSSRSNISRVQPGQLLNLDEKKKLDLQFG